MNIIYKKSKSKDNIAMLKPFCAAFLILTIVISLVLSILEQNNYPDVSNNIFINECGISFYCSPEYRDVNTKAVFSLSLDNQESSDLTDFWTNDGSLGFKYPSIFHISSNEFLGSEIEHHIEISDNTGKIRIMIQVWNLGRPLSEFLELSKQTSRLKLKYFNESDITTVKGLSGKLWEYVMITADGKKTKISEAFFKKNHKMYRISIFAPESKWKENLSDIFNSILESFTVK